MKYRAFLLFLAGSVLLSAFVFRDALLGRSLLAPLDIPQTLFSKYKALNPNAGAIPANHYVIDTLTYDLPMQHTIYQAYKRGEMPWWDPYIYSGRPLFADPRVNVTDPIRLASYHLLPFEEAYNWTHLAHFILIGLGMFCLLRHFGFPTWSCLFWAWTYQFAGCFVMTHSDLWVKASFAYYPFLWLVWDAGAKDRLWWRLAQASVLIGCIFNSGNQQSHAYLVLFAMAFLVTYGWEWKERRLRVLSLVAVSGVLGACLAAPVLLSQVELFLANVREYGGPWKPIQTAGGIASFSAIFPWCLGTFRTLDVGKFVGQTGLGFHLFIGSAGFLLALFGAAAKSGGSRFRPVRRMALLLFAIYLLIVSTNLLSYFYARIAGMAVMGLIVLAAMGMEAVLSSPQPWRRAAWAIALATVTGTVALNVVALVIYPRLIDRVKQVVQARQGATMLEAAPALRMFQVENFPAEVSFHNPETLLATVSLLAFALLIGSRSLRTQPHLWVLMLVLNLVPVLMFAGRFIPRHPTELWTALKEGTTEQKKIVAKIAGSPYRLWERVPSLFEYAMPYNLSHLYQVRTVTGYTSLMVRNPHFLLPDAEDKIRPQLADWIYEANEPHAATGNLAPNPTPGMARFQWLDRTNRPFKVQDIGLSTIRLEFEPGPSGKLLWADAYYPGWRAQADGQPTSLTQAEPCFSQIVVPESTRSLVLHYQPRFLKAGLWLALGGLLGLGLLCGTAFRQREMPAA